MHPTQAHLCDVWLLVCVVWVGMTGEGLSVTRGFGEAFTKGTTTSKAGVKLPVLVISLTSHVHDAQTLDLHRKATHPALEPKENSLASCAEGLCGGRGASLAIV